MTVSEQLAAAIQYEDSLLAHALFLGIRNGYWKREDEAECIDFGKLDQEELERIKQQNLLGIRAVHLYSVPLGGKVYCMIFAHNEQDARKAYTRQYGKECQRIHDISYGLDNSFYDKEARSFRSWRELRDSLVDFPAIAAEYEK